MSQPAITAPLDPKRWTFAEPRNASKGLPDLKVPAMRGSNDEMSHNTKSVANQRDILEKVCRNLPHSAHPHFPAILVSVDHAG
jgi:hypothetical protein